VEGKSAEAPASQWGLGETNATEVIMGPTPAECKPSRDGNGKPCTVAELAWAKHLDPAWLVGELGLTDLPGGGVAIPYHDEPGNLLFHRQRDVPGGPRFRQPAGIKLRPYGLWRLDEARRVARLYVAEGESDAWSLWAAGLPAVGIPGAQAAGCLHAEDLEGFDQV
jgi:hypothetical protein